MDSAGVIEKLLQLIQLEIDVNHTYRLAVKKINDQIMRERLAEFEKQHVAHIERLSSEIRALGGATPDLSPDMKGYLISGFTALMGTTGDAGGLLGLKLGEDMTTDRYQEALAWEVPDPIKKIIKHHFSEEKIHLDYLTSNLKSLRRETG
jgi:uncharacterized protein (TIGR02284 family)